MRHLLPLEDVRSRVLARIVPLPRVSVGLGEAIGLATAEAIVAGEPVPPFANSAMDGYAVRKADCRDASDEEPVRLDVVGDLPAGRAPERAVGAGEAIRIMTGAAVPEGADGIVIVEHTESAGDEVIVHRPAGDHIRPAGGDVAVGDEVFAPGTELGPAHVGVLASLGLAAVLVRRRPRVGVLSTGDELAEAGAPLAPGQIRESNRPMLVGLVERSGCEPVDCGIAPDDDAAVAAALESGLAECDALVTSGGVSMGEYDFVKVVLERLGDMEWFQVAIRPAKPLAFGVVRGVPVFGLPGNPVSSAVSFELFARPALRKMMGHRDLFRPVVRGVAGEGMPRRPDGKVHFDRVWVASEGGRLVARPSGMQASNVLSALARANGLAVLPDGDGVEAGDPVDVMLLDLPAGSPAP